MFLWFFKIFGKSSEVFGNLRKISGRDRKCSYWFAGVEEFRSWLLRSPQMDLSKLLRASNDGKIEWNTSYPLHIYYPLQIFKAWDKYLLLAECEVRTASYGPSFFLPFMAQARSARAMKTRKEKTRIHNLLYGPSKRG